MAFGKQGSMGRGIGKQGQAYLGGVAYSAEAQTLFAAMTTPPTAARKQIINSCIVSLKNAGVWSKLDIFYMMAAGDSQAARLNWKSPSTFTISAVNSPTFTADRGFTGDGASSYLNTTFNPATAGGVFSQNSNHLGAFIQANASQQDIAECGTTDTNFAARGAAAVNKIGCRDANGANINTTATVTTALGHTLITRSVSTGFDVYKDGASFESEVQTSGALASNTILICGRNNGAGIPAAYNIRTYAGLSAGGALTAQNVADLRSAILTYLQAVGAA